MSDSINNDPLFLGLTRPTLILGVSLNFALLNIVVSSIVFIHTASIKVIILSIIIHGIGYYLCFKEPKFMELYITKLDKCNQCPNKIFYGGNSYSV